MAWCLQRLEEQQCTWGKTQLTPNRILMPNAWDSRLGTLLIRGSPSLSTEAYLAAKLPLGQPHADPIQLTFCWIWKGYTKWSQADQYPDPACSLAGQSFRVSAVLICEMGRIVYTQLHPD